MQSSFRRLGQLLLCCLIGATQAAMAASVPFTVESDGSYSYFLAGNTLSLSSPGDLILGGHNASNHGINLISYQSGQVRIGGFLELNELNTGSYLTDTGDALVISTFTIPGLLINTPGTLALIGTINGFDNMIINTGTGTCTNCSPPLDPDPGIIITGGSISVNPVPLPPALALLLSGLGLLGFASRRHQA